MVVVKRGDHNDGVVVIKEGHNRAVAIRGWSVTGCRVVILG